MCVWKKNKNYKNIIHKLRNFQGNYSKNWILDTEVWILNIIFKETFFRSNPILNTFLIQKFSFKTVQVTSCTSKVDCCANDAENHWTKVDIKSWNGLAQDLFWIIENQFRRSFRLSGCKWKYLFIFRWQKSCRSQEIPIAKSSFSVTASR